MKSVPCPECGFDLEVGKIEDNTHRLVQCENCSRELMIKARDGELSTESFLQDNSQETDEYVQSLNAEFEGY